MGIRLFALSATLLAVCVALSAGQEEDQDFCDAINCDFEEGLEACEAYQTYGDPAEPIRSKNGRNKHKHHAMRQYYEALNQLTSMWNSGRGKRAAEEDEEETDDRPADPFMRSFVITEVTHYDVKENEYTNKYAAAHLKPDETAHMEIKMQNQLTTDVLIKIRLFRSSTKMSILYCCDEQCDYLKPKRGKWAHAILQCHEGAQLITFMCSNGGKEMESCAIDNIEIITGMECEEEEEKKRSASISPSSACAPADGGHLRRRTGALLLLLLAGGALCAIAAAAAVGKCGKARPQAAAVVWREKRDDRRASWYEPKMAW